MGPNGSGKSSIVTALSICLGGDLAGLNRWLEGGVVAGSRLMVAGTDSSVVLPPLANVGETRRIRHT